MGPIGLPRPLLPVITGPTAVGKTEVALAVAEALGAEIVCADSMQLYRRMEAGTAKPTAEQQKVVPHHLLDIVDPAVDFTVADYRDAALPILRGLIASARLPILVGGSRLYIRSLTAPFVSGPAPDSTWRAGLARTTSAELHARLTVIDPPTALRLNPADRKRIIRAIEVHMLTGEAISSLQAGSRATGADFRPMIMALTRPREETYERVSSRVDLMLASGLVDEVKAFLEEGLGPERIAMQAHGYKEIMGYLQGRYDREEAVRLLKRNTRRYVKCQLTWLRGEPNVRWVDATRPLGDVSKEIVSIIECSTS